MEVSLLALEGVSKVPRTLTTDSRGFFANMNLPDSLFNPRQLTFCSAQNYLRGTIRGIHFQDSPFAERKIVSVGYGESFHIFLDVRKHSSTYLSFATANIKQSSEFGIYVPEGVAHGYQTLQDDTSINYLISGNYVASHQKCINVFDPKLRVKWPLAVSNISERDLRGSYLDSINEDCGW